MEIYNDFAISPQNFDAMAKEYAMQKQSSIFSVNKQGVSKEDIKYLFSKLEYLRVLIVDLQKRTSNADILLVLDELSKTLYEQNQKLSNLFDGVTWIQTDDEENYKMFCNNLKIAINTTSDIVKLLISIKDDEQTPSETKSLLTDSINVFLDFNNKLVSLFGECRYLRY